MVDHPQLLDLDALASLRRLQSLEGSETLSIFWISDRLRPHTVTYTYQEALLARVGDAWRVAHRGARLTQIKVGVCGYTGTSTRVPLAVPGTPLEKSDQLQS